MPAAESSAAAAPVYTYKYDMLNMAEYLIKTITLEGTFDLSTPAASVASSADAPLFSPAATTKIVICRVWSDAPL